MNPDLPSPESSPEQRRVFRAAALSVASEKHLDINEDEYISDPDEGTFGVLDGMSNPKGGDIASTKAMVAIRNQLRSVNSDIELDVARKKMADAFLAGDQAIKAYQSSHPYYRRIGTTATAIKLIRNAENEQHAIIGHIGDSRAYLWRPDGTMESLTLDHHIGTKEAANREAALALQKRLAEVKNISELSRDELYHYLQQNRITRFLGIGGQPDISSVKVKPGDKIVLTSDGIHDNLTDQEITAIVAETATPEDTVRILVTAAQQRTHDHDATGERQHLRAKPDDMTALVVEIGD